VQSKIFIHVFRNNFAARSLSRREIAEIQLRALIDDPVESLPRFVHGVGAMSLEEVSKQLNTQPFIIERLLKVIDSLTVSSDVPSMNQSNVIGLTRALNSSLDVRILVFFMMLDENGNNVVTRNVLSQFLERYFKSMKFDTSRLQEAVQILLQRFHLKTVRFACPIYFHPNLFLSHRRKLKSVLRNFIRSSPKIQLYLKHSLILRFLQPGSCHYHRLTLIPISLNDFVPISVGMRHFTISINQN
jgi:hypothetical protein